MFQGEHAEKSSGSEQGIQNTEKGELPQQCGIFYVFFQKYLKKEG